MKPDTQTAMSPQDGGERSEEREISLAEIFNIILRRKYGILAFIVLAMLFALGYHYTQVPEYRAESMMMIADSRGEGDLLAAALGTAGNADNQAVKKDVELLMSMPIAELTVRELYKCSKKDSLEFFNKRNYQSPVSRFLGAITGIASLNASTQPQAWNYSDERLRLDALRLNSRIRVQPARETNVLKVSVASPFPDEAAFLSNMLCQVYKDADISRNSEKYTQANRFIAAMLDEQESKVADADHALSEYMESNEIYELTGNSGQLLQKLVDADAKYKSIQAESNIASNSLAFLEKKLSETDRTISSEIARNVTSQLGAIMDEIKGLESEYMKMVREKGIEHVDVKAKKRQLDMVKTRYEQLSRSKIAGQIGYAGKARKFSFDMVSEKLQIQRKLNDLHFSAGEFSQLRQYYEQLLSELPKKQQDYLKLQRDREVVGKTYLYLKEKLDETRIMLGSEVGGVALIGSAFQPFAPEKPSFSRDMLMGLVLGGLLAVLYAITAEHFDDTIKDESVFRNKGLAMLSFIPFVAAKKASVLPREFSGMKRKKALYDAGNGVSESSVAEPVDPPVLMITDSLSSSFAESFRALRTALDYSRVDGSLKSILVSGTAMSEGKSTVCCNLGMAFALAGKKTLVIDGDFRRSSIHKKLNGRREAGLTDYLFGQEQAMDESWFQKTHVDNLVFLSAGKKVPNPNELLGSAKMLEFIRCMEGRFDKILIDSPPLFLSDAAQLARAIDGVLLVSRLHFTSRKSIQTFATDHFLRSLLLGVALIGSREKKWHGYGKYGYGRYDELGA